MNDGNLKPFKKGDARINRKGRPKDFGGLRELAQEIAHEEAKAKEKPIIFNGKIATVAEAILRKWATSSDARLQMKFIAIAYGEVPQETKHIGDKDNPVAITINDWRKQSGVARQQASQAVADFEDE